MSISRKGSRRESQARKAHSKTRRDKPSTDRSYESSCHQRPVLVSCISFFRNPVAVITLVIAVAALITTWVHYSQLTKPHAELEGVNTRLSLLNQQIDLLKEYFDAHDVSERPSGSEQAINQVEGLRNGALAYIQSNDIPRSLTLIATASEVINRYLPNETYIKAGTVSISAAPFNGWVSIDVPQDTTAESEDGEPVSRITIATASSPRDAYRDYTDVLAFQILPTGTVFSSPVTLTFYYLVSNIPEGVAEEDLVLGTWDDTAGHWIILPSHVDLEAHTITTSINHLTLFAVLAPRQN